MYSEEISVSVIIPTYKDWSRLYLCLKALSNQSLNDTFEILVVNNAPNDITPKDLIIPENCSILSESRPGSYAARNKALSIAKGNIILTTDADCIPPKNWIKIITSYFTKETGMVVGMAPLKSTYWWLSSFISMDALTADILAYGSLGWGHAVACAGRNFAYRKSVFMEVNGFSGINHIITGDDDLFLQKVAKMTNWKIQFSTNLTKSEFFMYMKNLLNYLNTDIVIF